MIDIDNYKRAIEWLRRGISELNNDPASPTLRLGILHSFEVTYNLSESILRQAYVSLGSEENAAYISARELILHASDEGLVLSSPKRWMHYGFVLESMREACMDSVDETVVMSQELLLEFAQELEAFAHSMKTRGLAIA
jgi:hypothetical protein